MTDRRHCPCDFFEMIEKSLPSEVKINQDMFVLLSPSLCIAKSLKETKKCLLENFLSEKTLPFVYDCRVCLLNFQHILYMYLSQQTSVFRWLGFPAVENPKGSQELKIVRPPSTRQGRHCSQHVHLSQQALPRLVGVRC